jgi:hypothetical protein
MRSAVACWRSLSPGKELIGETPGCKESSSSSTPTCGAPSSDGCACCCCVACGKVTRADVAHAHGQPADSLEIYKDDEYIIGDRDLLVNRRASNTWRLIARCRRDTSTHTRLLQMVDAGLSASPGTWAASTAAPLWRASCAAAWTQQASRRRCRRTPPRRRGRATGQTF